MAFNSETARFRCAHKSGVMGANWAVPSHLSYFVFQDDFKEQQELESSQSYLNLNAIYPVTKFLKFSARGINS